MSKRVAVGGGPRTGKTTSSGGGALHTDDLIPTHGWSEASDRVAGWFDKPGDIEVEGVAVARGLRKWLAANPEGRPVDHVVWLRKPHVPLTAGQAAMQKGCETVFREIAPELEKRGVKIEYR